MKLFLAVVILTLTSCAATYDSPRTGIQYRFEVPLEAVFPHIRVSPDK